ncbi:MAG: hypothetical protein ABSA53_33795 [Streptosporangiaceae bacterium]
MFLPPATGSQLARQRHHDLQAQAGQQRLLHQLRQHARASRPAGQTRRRITQLLKRTRSAALPSS